MGGAILKLSKTSLMDEAAATGFRPDTLEKVIRLLIYSLDFIPNHDAT